MVWRTAHGDQKARGRLIVQETVPADELPAPPKRANGNGRVNGKFARGNKCASTRGRNKRLCLEPAGMWAEMEARWPPEWRNARRSGRLAVKHRISELAKTHGDLSLGVCSLLTEAYEMRADAKYLRSIAALPQREVPDAPRAARVSMVDLLRLATQLSTSARQAERDAWELATREAQARKVDDPLGDARARVLETHGEEPGRSDKSDGDGDD